MDQPTTGDIIHDARASRKRWCLPLAVAACAVVLGEALIFGHAYMKRSRPLPISRGVVASEEIRSDDIDAFMVGSLRTTGVPGAAIAAVHGGRVVYTAGYGSTSGELALSPDTPMLAASLAKSVTALAVMQLVERGKVMLETPAQSVVPQLRFADSRGARITIAQLLNQSSGIDRRALAARFPVARTVDEALAHVSATSLAAEPGTRWQYCNENYLILTRVIENVSGQSYAAYLAMNVFSPLGMTHTRISQAYRESTPGVDEGYVLAYGFAFARRPPDEVSAGAGGLITTANDLARWLALFGHGGRSADGTQVISGASIDAMWSSLAPDSNYAFGWRRESLADGAAHVFHSGRLPTYSAHQSLFTQSGAGYAIVWNSLHPLGGEQSGFIHGLDALMHGKSPAPVRPIGVIADGILAALTALCFTLGVLGFARARNWASRVRRPLPRTIAYSIVALFIVAMPWIGRALGWNLSWSTVFAIWPAVGVLLITLGLTCVVTTVSRTWWVRTL